MVGITSYRLAGVAFHAELFWERKRDGAFSSAKATEYQELLHIAVTGSAKRSICQSDGGVSLLERLGIAAEMKPKTKPSTLGMLYASVASGDVEIGFNQISEILAQPTVEPAGPLPPAIQNYTQFAPGIVSGSSQADAGRALVTFLTSPAAQTVLKAKGFE